ncbi:MAG: CoA transferase [Nitriliruptorales bacterium]|nr:CoA transferase [Nitriliruptorales bacterium]
MADDAPLNGIRVIDLSRILAGPLSAMLLGDLGADVVKVEQPGKGDDTRGWGPPFAGGESAYFLGVNRNKRSITLDLRSEDGRAVLRRLIVGADVVLDNYKLGTLERWGFDDAWFEEHAPRVVRCSIGGYGSTGPQAGRSGYDFILQAETGLMSITGKADGDPTKLGVAIVDICSGLLSTISILSALTGRAVTGRGRRAEVALYDTGLMMLANVASNHLVSGEAAGRYGNGHPNIVPYRTFRTADGDLAVTVGNDAQFAKLAKLLDHPEWAEDPRFARNRDRVEHRDVVDGLVQEALSARSRGDWMVLFEAAGIPAGPINTVPEALSAPQTVAREMVVAVEHAAAGTVRLLGSPLRFGSAPCPVRRPPPQLGEHTEEVLVGELGMNLQDVERLRRDGVI